MDCDIGVKKQLIEPRVMTQYRKEMSSLLGDKGDKGGRFRKQVIDTDIERTDKQIV